MLGCRYPNRGSLEQFLTRLLGKLETNSYIRLELHSSWFFYVRVCALYVYNIVVRDLEVSCYTLFFGLFYMKTRQKWWY